MLSGQEGGDTFLADYAGCDELFFLPPELASYPHSLLLFDSLGRLALKIEPVEQEVDISGLAPGIYTVYLAIPGKTYIGRLAVQ